MSDPATNLRSYGPDVELHDLTPLPTSDLARARGLARLQVTSCDACKLRLDCQSPVPFSGPPRPSYAVVGEAPGKDEDERGEPFIGRSGRFLRAVMRESGIDPDKAAWMNAVSCRPKDNKTPVVPELQACRVNLLRQLNVANCRYVFLAGGVATKCWRGDVNVSEVHGDTFLWMQRYVVMPIFHPSAILRDRSLKVPLRNDLTRYGFAMASGELMPRSKCVKCIAWADRYDRDLVPYCEQHWKRYGGTWKKEMRKWKIQDVESLESGTQLSLGVG